jgi:hypothetical protein
MNLLQKRTFCSMNKRYFCTDKNKFIQLYTHFFIDRFLSLFYFLKPILESKGGVFLNPKKYSSLNIPNYSYLKTTYFYLQLKSLDMFYK